jgi:glucose/arabinose dehydrogenase/PKD repeat protein
MMPRPWLAVATTVFLGVMTASPAAADITTALAGYWTLNQTSGTSAPDTSGNNNMGTLINGPLWTTSGKLGGGLTFDGVNDYVSIPDANVLDPAAAGTIAAWVNPAGSGWRTIIAKGTSSDAANAYAAEISPANRVQCAIGNGATYNFALSTATLAANIWYHVACVWNGASLQVFINGAASGSVAQTITPYNNSQPVQLGRWGSSDYLRGTLDEVRMYRRALVASDLTELYNFTGAPPVPDTTAPTIPGGLTATAISPAQINLSWSASSDNVGVAGYNLLRNGVQVVAQSATSYSDTGLSRGTTYSYTVSAYDAAGNTSSASTAVTAATAAFVLSSVQSSGITTNRATITWTTDVATSSQIDYGTTTAYGQSTVLDPALVTNHSQLLSGLGTNTLYHYRVRSKDSAGREVVSNDFVLTTSSATEPGVFQNEIITTGLDFPVQIKFLPNGDMLILEMGGRIFILPPGATQANPAPFLVLTNIPSNNGYQGLFDLVLDPDFATNRYYYVFYTLDTPNVDRVSRFTATSDLRGTISGSEFVLYQDTLPAGQDHHGGALNFAADGKLYITTGENFVAQRAQQLTNTQGKILRINKDGTIPADNPFYDGTGPNADAIWALGLRNPFRSWIDPIDNRFYIGDVGGNVYSTAIEELDLGTRGANYGWPNCEGNCTAPPYTLPLYSYPHNGRDACITGGFVYHGNQFPSTYRGSYFFADYAQNWIKRLTFDASGNVSGVFNFEPPDGAPDGPYGDIVALTEGPDGALYYIDLGFNDTCSSCTTISKIRRIRFIPNNQPPVAAATASPTESPTAPVTVNFQSTGSSDPDGDQISYSWDFGDGSALSTAPGPSHTYNRTGQYVVRLTVSDGRATTGANPIAITIGNRPAPAISSPLDGALFRAGDVITYSGDATDPENGTLPASAFVWNIDFLHEGHVHPGPTLPGVKSGTFTIPVSGHDFSGNTRYRFTLTVTDSDGLATATTATIFPEKVNLTFETVPAGLTIQVDSLPHTTPYVHDTLIGFTHTIKAPDQSQGSTNYTFSLWSDGGAQEHSITVPTSAQSLQATYAVAQNPIPQGLVAGYKMNESTGLTLNDASGNGMHGTLINGPAWTTSGKFSGGLNFDGVNDYVNIPDATVLDLTSVGTISAWVMPRGTGWRSVMAKGTGGDASHSYAMEISDQNRVQCAIGNGTSYNFVLSANVLTLNSWQHLACVWDGANLRVFVNGVQAGSVVQTIIPANNSNPLMLGRWNVSDYLNGILDEPRVYNRALTASEIQSQMNTPLP